MSTTRTSYSSLFNEEYPIVERYQLHESTVLAEIANLSDRTCEQQEEQYTIRRLINQHVQFIQPNLRWNKMTEQESQTVNHVVTIGYGIPITVEQYGVFGLYFGLPEGVDDDRSEFVHFGEIQSRSQPMLMIEFRIPRDLWDRNGATWFQSIRDRDLRWLKRVVEAYHQDEFKHNDRIVELIHRGVSDRYKFVRNLPLILEELPLPFDVTEATNVSTKGFRDPKYRVHKRYWFGQQEGQCKGCKKEFHFNEMTVDHIVPKSKGGANEFDNLLLLCEPCNSLKADNTMDDLYAALEKQGSSDADLRPHQP